MNVSLGERWEVFVESVVKSGRYNSASEVVREGLRLVEEREARLRALCDTFECLDRRGQSGYGRGARGFPGGKIG